MNKVVIELIGGAIFVIMGLVFALFHKPIAQRTAAFYYKFLHVHFSERGYQIVFLLVGIVFVAFGLVSIFQTIEFLKHG
jgi:hypothetical protein